MIVQTYFPQKLSPARYDSYLAAGWFRGSVMLYKMDLLCVEQDLFSVVNIRLNLENYSHKKRMRKLLRKNDSKFRMEVNKATITREKESLYQSQKKKFKGFIHNTLHDYLNAGFPATVFNTMEVAVYDEDKLVAVSFFDLGEHSMASLLGLYNEEYAAYSLGKYTMLKELEFGQSRGFKWYYPGYVLDKQSSFNYKLQFGQYEYYNNNKRWVSYSNFDSSETLAYELKKKHEILNKAMNLCNVETKSVLYPYFSMGYMNFWNAGFVRFPLLELVEISGFWIVAAFDVEDKIYKLFRVSTADDYERLINMDMSKEYEDSGHYFNELLMEEEFLEEDADPALIAKRLAGILNSPVY